jgi:hypothetical protein
VLLAAKVICSDHSLFENAEKVFDVVRAETGLVDVFPIKVMHRLVARVSLAYVAIEIAFVSHER